MRRRARGRPRLGWRWVTRRGGAADARRSSSTRCWSLRGEPRRGLMLGRTRRVHFVGVGGIGMSGIAELLANLGYEVSGSDVKGSDVTARLQQRLNVRVVEGHAAGNVGDAE